jgi:hypothetical protein
MGHREQKQGSSARIDRRWSHKGKALVDNFVTTRPPSFQTKQQISTGYNNNCFARNSLAMPCFQ